MTAPAYGYAHRGRVLRAGNAEGHYVVHIPALAPGCASGPFQSTIRDLEPGDNVLLTQVGLTVGDLVITGRLPERPPDFTLPINISDVSGLQTALNDRATDAELAAVNSALTASILTEHNTNVSQAGLITGLDGRLTTNEALDVTQNGRLTTNEGNITSLTSTVSGHTSTLSTHTGQITALQTYSQVFRDAHEFDVYGDLLSSFPRLQMANLRTLTPQAAYIWRTRLRVGAGFNRLRVVVNTAGTGGGAVTGTLLTSSTAAGPYTVAGTGTATLLATGQQDINFAATANVSAGTYVILMLWCNNSYTATPKITAWTGAISVNVGGLNPTIIWGTKTGLAAAPTTVTITDGTWTADTAPWWVAAAN